MKNQKTVEINVQNNKGIVASNIVFPDGRKKFGVDMIPHPSDDNTFAVREWNAMTNKFEFVGELVVEDAVEFAFTRTARIVADAMSEGFGL